MLFCLDEFLIHMRVMIMLDEPSYTHHMFSNKTIDQPRSSFDVQSQCEHLIGGDSMWRISHVNQSYRVCTFLRCLACSIFVISYRFAILIRNSLLSRPMLMILFSLRRLNFDKMDDFQF